MKTDKIFFTDYDLHLLTEGTHHRSWEKLGAHPIELGGIKGTHFTVWAPNAKRVDLLGDFNGWESGRHTMTNRDDSGYWQIFVPDVSAGAVYKYDITSQYNKYRVQKSDPFAFYCEKRPATASIVWDIAGYEWGDRDWMKERVNRNSLDAPIAVYELHLGSWMRRERRRLADLPGDSR